MKSPFGQLSLFAIFVLLSNIVVGQDSILVKSYLNDKVKISVPSSLKELDSNAIADRFPNPKERPTVLLIDKEELTSLKIIKMPQEVADNEVGQYKGFHMSQMKKEPNLKWIGDGLKKINNK